MRLQAFLSGMVKLRKTLVKLMGEISSENAILDRVRVVGPEGFEPPTKGL